MKSILLAVMATVFLFCNAVAQNFQATTLYAGEHYRIVVQPGDSSVMAIGFQDPFKINSSAKVFMLSAPEAAAINGMKVPEGKIIIFSVYYSEEKEAFVLASYFLGDNPVLPRKAAYIVAERKPGEGAQRGGPSLLSWYQSTFPFGPLTQTKKD